MKAFRWLAPLAALALGAWAQPLSHVRIVRISFASGDVQLNQQDGRGWQKAMLNAPISESDQLRTGAEARAEVELEDGSTVRLIPNSEVTFQQLALSNGTRLTGVALNEGSGLFTLFEKDARAFRVIVPGGQISTPYGATSFRIDLSSNGADVHVLSGKTNIAAAGQQYLVKKNETLSVVGEQPSLAKSKETDQWDKWSKLRDEQIMAKSSEPASVFGLSELSMFGGWSGNCWSPAGMPFGWTPWMSGNWFFDPIAGYNWVSPYQWGWLPYHYGSWMMMNGGGYCWSPGTSLAMLYGDPWMMFEPYPVVYGPGGARVLPPAHPAAPLGVRTPSNYIAHLPTRTTPVRPTSAAMLSSAQRAALQRAELTQRTQMHEIQMARQHELWGAQVRAQARAEAQAPRSSANAAWGLSAQTSNTATSTRSMSTSSMSTGSVGSARAGSAAGSGSRR